MREGLKLLPCPFCGGEAEVNLTKYGEFNVFCTKCKASTNYIKEDDAYSGEVEVWIDGQPYYQKAKTARQKVMIAWNSRVKMTEEGNENERNI